MTIRCVNWILSRRCNLKCDYCRISRNYYKSPYPDLNYFFKNEMSTNFIINSLDWFKNYNKNCFHLFYGGEPLLRKDLPDIINYCNKNDIFYTIITNNTDKIQDEIRRLFSKVEYISGFTISVDPVINNHNGISHRFDKSQQGLKNLMTYINGIQDPVAEITIDNTNIDNVIPLVRKLTSKKINSSITVIDISKNKFYDFSNIKDSNLCVQKNKIIDIFDQLISEKLNIHMADILLPKILDILPSELDCRLEDNVHNLTIDADGSVRLCLRIRGIETPKSLFYYFNKLDELKENIKIDKLKYCQKCNWTCPLMTILDYHEEMNHVERRL